MIVFSTTAEKFFNEFFLMEYLRGRVGGIEVKEKLAINAPKNKNYVKLWLKCFAIYRFDRVCNGMETGGV